MSKYKLYTKHLLTSFVLFLVLMGLLFFLRVPIQNTIINLPNYISDDFSLLERYFIIIFLSISVMVVFLSFIFYLLLTHKTRFDLEIVGKKGSQTLSKDQLRKLYENAPVPYVILNENAEIQDANKAALRFFGVFPEEINEKNFFSYLSGEDKEQAIKFSQYYKAHIPINRREVEMITKKGDIRLVQLSIFEMTNPGRFSNAGLAMIFDITEQKLLDKAKTEFVSLASHQLKSPLATTKWFTEMLISGDIGELSPKQKEYLDKLHTANEDMIDLVDVLLNVSRMEMGSLVSEIKSTNVEELSDDVLEELSVLITQKNIHVNKQYNGLLQNIPSDPKLLRIVIQNLISNAVKYTPEGGTVSVSFEESREEIRIIVADTGLGIPKEQQGRIFTKLFRADNVRNLSNSQGTGLGLYLVKSIVSSIGGDISFVSEENKGSTFVITIKT